MKVRRAIAVGLAAVAIVTVGAVMPGRAGAAAPAVPVVAAAPTADPGATPAYVRTLAQYSHQALTWQDCYPGEDLPQYQCTHVTAPRDWFHPATGTISLSVSRKLAGDPAHRHGILLTNPGGPGDAGLDLTAIMDQYEPTISADFDIIGMNPRGVSDSTSLDCDPSLLDQLYSLDGQDTSAANVLRQLSLSRQYAVGCGHNALTPVINTDQTARDLDLLRAVFGESKVSYVGFSGGTWLGAWYATLFPSRVDRFVFDGVADYTSTWDHVFGLQPAAFQNRYQVDFLPWVARYDSLYHLGRTPQAVSTSIARIRAQLAAAPLTLPSGATLAPADLDSGLLNAMYIASYTFQPAAESLSILTRYATATLDEQAEVEDNFGPVPNDDESNVFMAVTCGETTNPTPAQVIAGWNHDRIPFPLDGPSELQNPCPYWPNRPIGSPVTGKGIPPLLMISDDHDPATAYSGALDAHHQTKGSVMVTVTNEGDHTIYSYDTDPCVENITNNWLLTGRLPAHDTTCPGIPLPVPTAPTATASAAASTVGTTNGSMLRSAGAPFGRSDESRRHHGL